LCAQLMCDLFAIAKFLLNPYLKHTSTEGPISNHSMTLIMAPAIRLIGRHLACFKKIVYLLPGFY